nr:MAG TPA: hypothetical protein [Caudoviricetes sp.]
MTTGGGSSLFSLWLLMGRVGTTALLCLVFFQIKVDTMIDVTKFGVNEEYMVYMLIASIFLGFLAAVALRAYDHNKAADHKADKGEIPNTNSLPYDKRYDLCTAIAFICGSAIGMYATPVIIDAFIVGAGQWTYIGIAALASAFFVVVLMRLLHLGVREFVIQAGKYAVDTSEALKDAKKDIDTAVGNLNELNPKQ